MARSVSCASPMRDAPARSGGRGTASTPSRFCSPRLRLASASSAGSAWSFDAAAAALDFGDDPEGAVDRPAHAFEGAALRAQDVQRRRSAVEEIADVGQRQAQRLQRDDVAHAAQIPAE